MAKYQLTCLLLIICMMSLCTLAQEEESEDVDGRTLGLFKHRGHKYSYQPQPSFLGSLFGFGNSLFGGNPYYRPEYYGNGYGYGGGYGSPFIGGQPVNPGGFYRPGFQHHPSYQQFPGGYGGGYFRDGPSSKDLELDID